MAIIDDILDYSKIESGKLSMERSILDMVKQRENCSIVQNFNFFLYCIGVRHRECSKVGSSQLS